MFALKTGEVLKFVKCSHELYFHNTDSLNYNTKNKNKINDYIAVQTVSNIKEYFTVNEIKGTDKSRAYQELLCFRCVNFQKLRKENI